MPGGVTRATSVLPNIRASWINGCAFWLHMHLWDARKAGHCVSWLRRLDNSLLSKVLTSFGWSGS